MILPAGLETIASNAFTACDSLVNVTIPASVNSIGMSAFSGSYLLSATFENPENWYEGDSETSLDLSDPSKNGTLLNNATATWTHKN